jgi:hypothetical protein
MSYSREELIRVLVFNGKKEDWPAWEEKFLAKATRKQIKEILVDDTIAIPKSSEVLEVRDLKKLAIRKMNNIAKSTTGRNVLSLVAHKAKNQDELSDKSDLLKSVRKVFLARNNPTLKNQLEWSVQLTCE